ncbi:MAG: tRNA (guanosine(37)-N1)-methyltransferase TrmD [Candidatus Dojkabacteria bacterium]|nr:tRNA (guanosine(37)-N1)-methyltransferase TrmD [Candidatus Dojkabacteria bacterium]MDQ7020696.1 tRNA (guanosine(37)-N1)-methyltransferase TrmD [Candidatus Dojkabacteria bacterium]
MKIDIITAFPGVFAYFKESIPKIAEEKGLVKINIVDIRDFSSDTRRSIDDKPFGGGQGMLLMIEPIYKALKSIVPERFSSKDSNKKTKILMTSARGRSWRQSDAESYKDKIEHLIIICGHYEGVDQRVIDNFVDEEISIGNYVLSGGELPAMVISDSILRLIPGVVGTNESVIDETSFNKDSKLIEYPQYTRPATFTTDEGLDLKVPDILLSGHHANIEKWKASNQKEVSL